MIRGKARGYCQSKIPPQLTQHGGGTLGEQSGGTVGTDSLSQAISYTSVNETRITTRSGEHRLEPTGGSRGDSSFKFTSATAGYQNFKNLKNVYGDTQNTIDT